MSVASLQRQFPVLGGDVINERPMRYPDVNAPAVMNRRGWWLVALNFLIPGAAQAVAGKRRIGKLGLASTITMWALVLVAVLLSLLWRPVFLQIAINSWFLLALQVILAAYAVLWAFLTINTLVLVKLVRTGTATRALILLLTLALMVFSSGGAALGSSYAGSARATLGDLFGTSAPAVPPSNGYYNILLLGADSGEGRDSMRFDSISVVSVNADTGATTITGIPRDMANVPFAPGPMNDIYPSGHTSFTDPNCGWGSAINQLRTEVEVCRDGDALYPEARANGSTPGIEATKDAAEGILGVEIPFYVFIDMGGFAAMIDALGGVDVTVEQRLPKGGGPAYEGQSAEDWAIGWIEAGPQHMDGDTAQWYARSRYTTSDWDRMGRQRILQKAILEQFTPGTVITRFNEILAAGENLVQTDIPETMLGSFSDLAVKAKELPVQSIELTPESGIDPESPNYEDVRALVQAGLYPPETDE